MKLNKKEKQSFLIMKKICESILDEKEIRLTHAEFKAAENLCYQFSKLIKKIDIKENNLIFKRGKAGVPIIKNSRCEPWINTYLHFPFQFKDKDNVNEK